MPRRRGGGPWRGRQYGAFRCRRGGDLSRGGPALRLIYGPFRGWPIRRSSEPPQASTSNGKSSVRAKTPKYSLGFLISLQSLRLLGCGGVARPNTSTRRGITCHRAWRGGVNDPAGFPPGVRFDSAGAVRWVCSVGGPMAKTTRPEEKA